MVRIYRNFQGKTNTQKARRIAKQKKKRRNKSKKDHECTYVCSENCHRIGIKDKYQPFTGLLTETTLCLVAAANNENN